MLGAACLKASEQVKKNKVTQMWNDFLCFFFDTLSRDCLALGMLVLQSDKIAIGNVFLKGKAKVLKTLKSMFDLHYFMHFAQFHPSYLQEISHASIAHSVLFLETEESFT